MGKRNGKLPPQNKGTYCYREAHVAARAEANDEDRSVRIVLASETPVPVFDFERFDVVDEVLLMDGLEVPRQLPMLNSHQRFDTRNVIGSIRELEKRDGQLIGRAFFAKSDDGQQTFDLIREGHLTDFSIGFMAERSEFVPEDETRSVGDRTFSGPVRLVTQSRAKEGSAVAIGADETAKVQEVPALRAYLDPESLREEKAVDKLKELLVARGMPETTEGADVFKWLEKHLNEHTEKERKEDDGLQELLQVVRELKDKPTDTSPADRKEETRKEETVDPKEYAKRCLAIRDMCDEHNIKREQADKWIEDDLTVEQVSHLILKEQSKSKNGDTAGPSTDIRATESELEKFGRAVSDGLVLRCIQGSGLNPHEALERAKGNYTYNGYQVQGKPDYDAVRRTESIVERLKKPAPGYDDFRYMSLLDIARAYLDRAGHETRGLPNQEIARRAIKMRDPMTTRTHAYHTTGSFTNVMLDAANKTLLSAFDEALTTYQVWVRQAPSASDFKQLNRIRFGELPDPEVVPENFPYPEKKPSDARESYRVEKYGEIFSISMEAIVNDDLNAIVRIPAMQGNAMRRKINRVCYSILTSNPSLSDGVALFHATSHGANLDSNTLTTTNLNTGYTVMQTQAGVDSTTVLNLMPRFLIVPAALAATALQIINSIGDPAVGGDTTGNANVQNIYGPNGPRRLMPVIEGQLDSSSTTAWWLAADTGQVDTIELTFLQGEEAPVLDREDGFEVDAIRYKIRQSFAAAAIDYRGLYQGNS